MKISWKWLSRHFDSEGLDPFEIAEKFVICVAEIERIEKKGENLKRIKIGKIISIKNHPSYEKLKIVEVVLGEGNKKISVAGAPNLKIGLLTPVALPGWKFPDGNFLREMEFGEIKSECALLSEFELGLSDEHTGVLEINEECEPGSEFIDVFPFEDYVIEIDNKSLTHRPDLWSHRGIAREICAITGKKLKKMDFSIEEGAENCLEVIVEDKILCPRYMAMVYENVKIASSPLWLKNFLRNIGIRPIYSVVDITNFVMCDIGNPIHAFDKKFIKGNQIIIRRAKKAELITTLDGIERLLTPDDLIIADKFTPIAIAGVMGGEETEVNFDTTEVVLESANFNAVSVRRTAIRHGLRTEASIRFEKSLDPNFPAQAISLFTKLLLMLCPSVKIKSPLYDVANYNNILPEIKFSSEFINKKLGIKIENEKIKNILKSLECKVEEKKEGEYVAVPPSFRATKDISIPEDISEEIGRLYGYHKITPIPPKVSLKFIPRGNVQNIERKIKTFLSLSCGFTEVMTYSFDNEPFLKKINFIPNSRCEILNPISSEMQFLKTSLIPNLLMAAEKNATSFEEFKIYETGRIFYNEKTEDRIPFQTRKCAGLYYNKNLNPDKEGVLLFKLKGVLEETFKMLNFWEINIIPEKYNENFPWIHKKRTLGIFYKNKFFGYISAINPLILKKLDLIGDISIFEFSIDEISEIKEKLKKFIPIPRFPSVSFDLCVLADENLAVVEIEKIISKVSGEILNELKLISVYKGEPIENGKKSITYRMIFLHRERTLKNEEIKELINKILENLKKIGVFLKE